ncbi:MAG TPA: FtsX-like permease family protein [Chitinophagaceae bacterium]
MNLASFIAWRIAFNQKKSFSRFIIRLATVATVISVTVMIITLAFTSGFQQVISQKVFSFWGHIRVQHFEPSKVAIAEELPIRRNDTVVQLLRGNKDIVTVQAFGTKNAILKTAEALEGVLFKGVENDYAFGNLKGFLQQGKWISFPDSNYSNQILLSEYTANQLQLKVNDQVLVYFIQSNGSAPRPRKLVISGIYRSGIEEFDRLIAFGDLRLIQRLNDWAQDEIGGYELFVSDYKKMDSVSLSIFEELPELWNSRTTRELYPHIFDWLNLQNQTIGIVISIMVVVAILNLITCLIILVLERTRMVGVLKALGSPNSNIQRIFLFHGSIITISGIIIGNIVGLLICWLQQNYGFIKLPEDMYYISTAAVNVEWWHIAAVDIGTFIICFAALLIPTLVVHRIQPVKAIQFR